MKEKRSSALKAAVGLGYWLFALLFWEMLLHFAVFGEFSPKFGYALGFTASFQYHDGK